MTIRSDSDPLAAASGSSVPETGEGPPPTAATADQDQTAPLASAPEPSRAPAGRPEAPQPGFEEALGELMQRRDSLRSEIRGLEQQRQRIQRELAASPLAQCELIAGRVKGFQAYLVAALQELAAAAEQADLVPSPVVVQPSPLDRPPDAGEAAQAPAAAGLFSEDEDLIRSALARYGGQPDFHADPWRLRRTLEPAAAALLEDWFLSQGGRGAQPSQGSRNRNTVVAAAAIAILGELYGDRFQTLVLAGQPERLGEWRRGLQDCLGLGREDFGPSSGIVLFERSETLVERADRLEERGELPFIVIDAAEGGVAIPILQFPLWLAFAATPGEIASEEDLY